ncbi:MAG: 50S ribosomal protein L7 [Firmicutes bacterium]|nr:50S ribosomal protein L7 [Bacillota bacterium]MDY6159774.1 50S ribosomal protein L7 [Candidatus Faecousia sp.]
MVSKALNYLSLARKGGLAELGEEPVGDLSRTGKAYVIAVASDASDHTWRRAKAYAAGTEQQCIRLPFTKEEMGEAVGRESLAIAAISDAALALALVQSLPEPEKYQAAIQVLTAKTQKLKKRRQEAKAHLRNVRKGKK